MAINTEKDNYNQQRIRKRGQADWKETGREAGNSFL